MLSLRGYPEVSLKQAREDRDELKRILESGKDPSLFVSKQAKKCWMPKLIFPNANSPQKSMSNNTLIYALYRLGYHSRMTGHGFRGTASSILHEQGYAHK